MKRPGDVLLRKRLTSIAGALWVVTLAIVLPRTSVSQSPTAVSAGYTLTMLSNGSWLVIGSSGKAGQTSAVIIERRTRQVQAAGALLHDRAWHTATALPDGTVLVAGGIDLAGHVLAAPEIFDPVRQSFEALPSSGLTPRAYHSATLLTDGTVLLAGGVGADGVAAAIGRHLGLSDANRMAAGVGDVGAAQSSGDTIASGRQRAGFRRFGGGRSIRRQSGDLRAMAPRVSILV